MTRLWIASVLLAAAPSTARAQSALAPRATMSRADSAYNSGDRGRARVLYAEILATDSSASRAVFRLAQLDDSEERALALYRRYIALEPGDPWGHMAEGDLLGRLGRVDEALVAYAGANAVAPGERDVFIGRARVLERAGRWSLAVDELAAWVTRHADDGEAWDLLGRSHMRGGRPRSAASAFSMATRLGVPGAERRFRLAASASSPFVTPEFASLGDSDGNRTTRYGGAVDVAPVDGLRLGAGVRQELVGNDVAEVRGLDLHARVASVLSRGVTLNADIGTMRYGGSRTGPGPRNVTGSWSTVHAMARLRARTPADGPSMDLRLERAPLGFNPDLVTNEVTRSEARATFEVPVGPLRARGSGRVGRIEALGESPNGRLTIEGGLVWPLGTRVLPSAQFRVSGFDRASAAGYFAPRLAQTLEAGAYLEAGEDGPVSLAADLGAGLQRITEHGASTGGWTRVWRAWAQGSVALGPSRAWSVEVEAYDSPFALDGASASGSWRFLSVSTGLRWALR
jgi:Flp pilus assembly protein TadD